MTRKLRLCSALLLMGGIIACSDLGSEPGIEHLEVRYLSAFIAADMMPVVPPDPNDRTSCTAEFIIRSSSGERLSVNLRVLRAGLRLSGVSAPRGTLYFSTAWDGILEPFQTDTVRVVKRQLSDGFVQPACDASVELDFEIGETENALVRLTTPPLTFSCVY